MSYSLTASPYRSRGSYSPAQLDAPPPVMDTTTVRPRADSAPVTLREVQQVRIGAHEWRMAGREFSSDEEASHAVLPEPWFAAVQAQQDPPAAALPLSLRKVAAGHTPVRLTRASLRPRSPDSEVWQVDSTAHWLRDETKSRAASTPAVKSRTPTPEPIAAIAGFTLSSARADAASLRQAIADGHGVALLKRMGTVLEALPDYPAARPDGKPTVPPRHAEWLALARVLADSGLVPRDGKSQASIGVEALAQHLPLSVRASLLMALATQVHTSGLRPNQLEDGMRLARLARCIVDWDLVGQPLALSARKSSLPLDLDFLLDLASDAGEGRIDATHAGYDLGRVMYACHVLVPFTGFFSPGERLAAAFAAKAQ